MGLPQHVPLECPLHAAPQDRLPSKPPSPFHQGASSHWGQECVDVRSLCFPGAVGLPEPGLLQGLPISEGFFICPQEFAEALWAEQRLLQPAARVVSKHSPRARRVPHLAGPKWLIKQNFGLDLGGLAMNIPAAGWAAASYPNAMRREGT